MNLSEKEQWRASRVRSVPQASPTPAQHTTIMVEADTSAIEARVAQLESANEALSQALAEAAADRAQIVEMLRLSGVIAAATNDAGPVDLLHTSKALDDRISSFAVKVERAA